MSRNFGESEGMERLFGSQKPKSIVPAPVEDVRGKGGKLPSDFIAEEKAREEKARTAWTSGKTTATDEEERVVADESWTQDEWEKREQKSQPKSTSNKKGKEASDYENPFQNGAEAAAGVFVGAAVNEAVDNIKGRKKEGKSKKAGEGGGVPPEPPKPPEKGKSEENDPIKNASFAKVMSMSNDPTLSNEDRNRWIEEKESRIEEFRKFDGGDFVADTRRRFQTILRTSEWDSEGGNGVYDRLISYSENRDHEYQSRNESEPRLKGLIGIAIRAEAARVLVAGIDNKFGTMEESERLLWLKNKHYSDGEIDRFNKLARENHIFDFATDAPEELVGSAIEARETPPRRVPVEDPAERRQSLREIPLYFGAVFRGGKNEVYVDRPDLIPTLDVTNAGDRTRFIFKNLYAFNYRFGKGSAWKGAVDDWTKDFKIANEIANLDPEVSGEFLKDLRAMMAVTASARAMEASAGITKTYLTTLVGANENREPILDEQDLSQTLLLHGDPEKMKRIIENPLVKPFYDKLMEDAGLINNASHEWREIVGSDGKKTWVSSTIELTNTPDFIRKNSPLMKYLGEFAKAGGFQKYIEDVLLKVDDPALADFDRDTRMTAAKIACDTFLVDKWTVWEDALQEHDKKDKNGKTINLKLQPLEEWGGNPLKGILKPTFLPRLKKVYTGKDEPILDLIDQAVRPMDIFQKYKGITEIHPVIPSMVTNMKTLSRLSDATYKVFGGSMATGIPSWSPKLMQEELPLMADLLTQVYGNLTVKENGKEIPIGKHMVGDMMMRILYAKALAATVESRRPNFKEKIGMVFADPQARNRPFLEVLQYLYGSNLDNSGGFISSLTGARTRLVIRDNKFKAGKYYDGLWKLLQTNDQAGGNDAYIIDNLRRGLAVINALGETMGYGGKR